MEWDGKAADVPRPRLPLQVVVVVNAARSDRDSSCDPGQGWCNKLVWGDNLQVLTALVDELAGQVDLIYIDPPFHSRQDCKVHIGAGDGDLIEFPPTLAATAYRDTWGMRVECYLKMLHQRLDPPPGAAVGSGLPVPAPGAERQPPRPRTRRDLWPVSWAPEKLGYDTQKPEALLERIITSSSDEGSIVLDCFAGSDTTAAVAERLKRRWVAVDIGRFAIHTTCKRLLGILQCAPFVIANLGHHERQAWQPASIGPPARRYLDSEPKARTQCHT